MARNPYNAPRGNIEWGRKARKAEDKAGRKHAADRFAVAEGLAELEAE